MESPRTPELQKQVRRLTAFGTAALFVVGAWALLLALAAVSGGRELGNQSDRVRLERAALDRASDLRASAQGAIAAVDARTIDRAAHDGEALRAILDSLAGEMPSRQTERPRVELFRATLARWDSAATRLIQDSAPAVRTSASAQLDSVYASTRRMGDSLLIEERNSSRTLMRRIVVVASFAAIITLGIVLLVWVLNRLGRDVVGQGRLVAEKQTLLEKQAEQLRQRAASLERVNSELNTALRAREESEALLNAALSAAPVGFAFVDRELRFRRVNEWMAKAHGVAMQEHTSRGVEQLHSPVADAFRPYYERVLASGQPLGNVEITTPAIEGKLGPRQWFANFYPIIVGERALLGVGAVVVDVTERRELEEQFRQSQKMEAVGRLAGGVAHDVNNLLTAIAGFAEFALTSLPPDHPARADVEQALDACHRGGGLTRQLLTFSRQQVMVPTMLSLNEIVVGMEPLLQRMIGTGISLKLKLDPGIHITKADKGQLEQVLMNLVLNARDAMPDGGQLTIATGNSMLDGVLHSPRDAAPRAGPHVMLSVTDTGTGMDAVTRERIFEPFFTTKPLGKGTGLGLATVYGIVKHSGGSIWVYSEPGQGTTFKVYFPAAEEVTPADQSITARAAPARGTGRILVVDDDEAIRALSVRALQSAGFDVLDAANGEQGLAIARGQQGIRAIVADVVMPIMGGREMMRQLSALGITVPVLYVSGWAAGAVDADSFLGERDAFLEKPFSPESLLRALHGVLAKQESPVGAQALL